MGRQHGTGRIYVKYGSYYGRWRTPAGRYVNLQGYVERRHREADRLVDAARRERRRASDDGE